MGKEAEVAGDQGVRQDVPPCPHLCAVVGSGSLGQAEASSGTGQGKGKPHGQENHREVPEHRPLRLPLPAPVAQQDAGLGPSWASPSEGAEPQGGCQDASALQPGGLFRAQRLKHHELHVSGSAGRAAGRASWALRFLESVGCGHLQAGSAGAAPVAQLPRSSAGFRACGLLGCGPLRHVGGLRRHAVETC